MGGLTGQDVVKYKKELSDAEEQKRQNAIETGLNKQSLGQRAAEAQQSASEAIKTRQVSILQKQLEVLLSQLDRETDLELQAITNQKIQRITQQLNKL